MSDSLLSILPTGTCRVLVADDDARLRESLSELLDGAGMTVTGVAADGHEAVSLAEGLDPDVILMDYRMPEMNGVEAAHELKRLRPLIQVIILSAYGDPGLRRGADAEGVFCYLVKGCAPTLIAEMVARACAYKRGLESSQ